MNVPNLRFKEFNEELHTFEIKDTGNVITGMTPSTADKENYGTEYLWVSPGDMGYSKYIANTKTKLSLKGFNKTRQLPDNSILVTCIGSTIGKMGMSNSTLSTNQQINSIIPTKIFNPNYLYYCINYNFPKFLNKISFQAVPIISKREFEKLKIKCTPNLSEQEKIGNMLDLLDKKIEHQSKKIEDLKLFKLYTENKLLNSSSSVHWKKIKLNDILIEGNKKTVKNTNDFKKITIKLNLKGLEFNESKREMSDRRPFYIREENEIIIGKQNYFNGSIAIVTKEFSGCICSNAIMSFKVKEGYNLKYIYLYLSQKRYMKEREFLANGTGQKELSEKEFLKFTIKVPEDSVVNNITNIIDKINKKINFENNKLNKLIELKKGLMQNIFV